MLTFSNVFAASLALIPYLAAAFFGDKLAATVDRLPVPVRIFSPASLVVPYLLVAGSTGTLRWYWIALYMLLPVAIAAVLHQASLRDQEHRGNWRDFAVLISLGLAVDLRWFEPAWPAHLAIFNKVLLLDAGIYGFLMIRKLDGVGFDLRLRLRDLTFGLREFLLYAPIAVILGLLLGFLHWHAIRPSPLNVEQRPHLYFFLYRGPGGDFFSGMASESAGAPG